MEPGTVELLQIVHGQAVATGVLKVAGEDAATGDVELRLAALTEVTR